MLAVLLPVLAGLVGLWLLVSAAMAWGARRAAALAALPGPAIFRAAPRAGPDAATARLAFLGDVQRGIADIVAPLGAALEAQAVDLVVSSGDLVSHGEAPYYGVVVAALDTPAMTTPMRAVPGNHDLWPRRSKDDRIGGALFEARFGSRHWCERVGPVLVVGLDNGADWLADEQLPWLEAALAEHPGVPWILVCHRPLYTFGGPAREVVHDMGGLVDALAARPPALVVSGHLHAFHDEIVDGVRHVINAHGGDVHGLAIRREDFQVLYVEATATGLETRLERYGRRRSIRTYLDQLAVRFWSDRRKPWGAVLAWPGRLLLRLLGADVPVVKHPVERRVPPREVLVARRKEPLAP